MNLLAIETSSIACSVALLRNDKIHAVFEVAPMQQAQMILPMIERLLKDTATTLQELDAIAFGCGPGSFTGVRIATSVAQGLGFASNLPLIPVSSLAALAQLTYKKMGWEKILVGVDARIQEVYWGAYQVNTEGLVELVGQEWVCTPQDVPLPSEPDWCGAGNAWDVYQNQIAYQPLNVNATELPHAEGVLLLAQKKFISKQTVKPYEARPTYLRDDVAKKSTSLK